MLDFAEFSQLVEDLDSIAYKPGWRVHSIRNATRQWLTERSEIVRAAAQRSPPPLARSTPAAAAARRQLTCGARPFVWRVAPVCAAAMARPL